MTIKEFQQKYLNKLSILDLEIIISSSINKSREFVLTHPEFKPSFFQSLRIRRLVNQRINKKPISQIIGSKEFFGINFKVTKHTLTPRPETEMIVEDVLKEISIEPNLISDVIDLGTGSGNIIISIAKNIPVHKNIEFFATDISRKALKIAKHNAIKQELQHKIIFIQGNLLEVIIKKYVSIFRQSGSIVITANLPYLSKKVYEESPKDVLKYEPKSALYSPEKGLQHYRKLLKQIHSIDTHITNHRADILLYIEISPEQKDGLEKIIQKEFPDAQIEFQKDLAQKWRVAKVRI
ncbi:peptide chain release factor N(5)-glutamine methyltransferase [Patescibacteria group bacterium]